MKKEKVLLRNFIIFFLFATTFLGVGLPIYGTENEEMKQLEMERQQALELIEGLKSSISSVQEDIDELTIEKKDIQSYIKSLCTKKTKIVTKKKVW